MEKKTTKASSKTTKKAAAPAKKEKKVEKKAVKKEPKKEAPIVDKEEKVEAEMPEFKGEYLKAVGRRKTSVAQVRMYRDGRGQIVVNGKKASQYFKGEGLNIATQPLKATGHQRDLNFSIIVKGGGQNGQVEACRHGIARCLLLLDPLLKDSLKLNGFLTRDPRKKERKKPGLRKARKRPQWSKR